MNIRPLVPNLLTGLHEGIRMQYFLALGALLLKADAWVLTTLLSAIAAFHALLLGWGTYRTYRKEKETPFQRLEQENRIRRHLDLPPEQEPAETALAPEQTGRLAPVQSGITVALSYFAGALLVMLSLGLNNAGMGWFIGSAGVLMLATGWLASSLPEALRRLIVAAALTGLLLLLATIL
ncbi:MAG TPA: hypothetical protein PKE07_12675 [Lacibacter sp.]|nr:hypothetical protein [Lacibacter sp.]HMO90246.1 hypothetical protein [Lacibacter sp.]